MVVFTDKGLNICGIDDDYAEQPKLIVQEME